MPTSVSRGEKITPLFTLAILRGADCYLGGRLASGTGECGAAGGILYRGPNRCLALYRALAVRKVVFRDPTGARTCNLGHLFDDQKPDLRVQRSIACGRRDCLAISLCAASAAGADPDSD